MASAPMPGSPRRPGGRYAEWTDSIEDDPPGAKEVESSTRVITAPLPRIDLPLATGTTTAPLGLRIDSRAEQALTSSEAPGEHTPSVEDAAPPPPSGRGHKLVEIRPDPMIDSLLDKLGSPLAPSLPPEGLALSAALMTPPASHVMPHPTSSVKVTDSVLKGKLAPDPARAAVTRMLSRPTPREEDRASPQQDEAEDAGLPTGRARAVAVVSITAAGVALALVLALRAANFFSPLPEAPHATPAQRHAAHEEPAVPPPPPAELAATALSARVTVATPPSPSFSARPTVAAPKISIAPAKPRATPKPAPSADDDDDLDPQIKIREKK